MCHKYILFKSTAHLIYHLNKIHYNILTEPLWCIDIKIHIPRVFCELSSYFQIFSRHFVLCAVRSRIFTCVSRETVSTLKCGRWWVIWKMRRTGEKTKMSRDVRHRMRHALEIGPRRNNLSYPHMPPTLSQVGERRMDRRERKGGETVAIELCRSRYIVQLCFPHPAASPIVNVTNTGDIFCYIITTILLSMNKREIDYLLYDVQFFI